MSIESVIPSNRLILCCPLLLPPSIFPSISLLNESVLRIRCSYTVQKNFLHCCKSSRTHNRFFNLGIWQRDWEPPREFVFEGSGIWLQNFYSTEETDSWRAQKKPYVKPGPRRKSSDPTRDWARFSCEFPGVSSRDMAPQWPVVRSGTLNTAVLGAVACCYNTWTRSPLPPLPLPYFGLRPNYREGIQPHQLAEN